MNFETDNQTKKDLSIFPAFKGESCIFDYYNYTSTNGGKQLLELFLESPLNEKSEIDNRISIINYLKESQLTFYLDKGNLDFIAYYLSLNIPVLKNNPIDSIGVGLANLVKPNNDYYIISKGLHCLKKHLQTLLFSLKSVDSDEVPEFILELKDALEKLRLHPEFNSFLDPRNAEFSFRQISSFDPLIRKNEKERIKNILRLTYFLDVYSSVAKSAKTNHLSFPVITNALTPELRIQGFFHPLLKQPVSNDFQIGGKLNFCFISGANMAGKSTFLKSIGICVYLSHVGFPVPAIKMQTSLFNGLYSTMNIPDNISKGHSHFYSEVKRIKDTVEMIQKKKKVLVIFDELFRGTNVKDAFDATLLISSGFTKIKNSLFFVSTHIIEVGKELEKQEAVCFKYFASGLEEGKPIYDYKLMDGIAFERLGLTIVKNEKIMEVIDQIVREN